MVIIISITLETMSTVFRQCRVIYPTVVSTVKVTNRLNIGPRELKLNGPFEAVRLHGILVTSVNNSSCMLHVM